MRRKGVVVMNGLLILAFEREIGKSRLCAQGENRVAQNVLNEFRILVRRLGNILLVRAL